MTGRKTPGWVVGAAVAALLTFGGSAGAATRVSWEAPASCPIEAEVASALERLLGEPLSTPRPQELTIQAEVSGEKPFRVRLRITTERGSDERLLEHESCARLAEAAELVIALAIDPERVKQRQLEPALAAAVVPAEAAEPPPAPPAAPAPESPAPPPSAVAVGARTDQALPPATSAAKPLSFRLGLNGFIGGGVLPVVARGLQADVSLWRGAFGFVLSGDAWATRSVEVQSDAPTRVNLRLISAGLAACARPLESPLGVAVCAGGRVGDMQANGEGVDDAQEQQGLWSALTTGLGLRYPAKAARLAATLSAEAGISLSRPRFGVVRNEQPEQVFRPTRWLWRTGLGIELLL
jgi:hypothetical protein